MNKTVMLIEDEERIREIIADYFMNEGFQILQAQDGKEALEIFGENKIDLIILDIMLPHLDGWSVCKRIRSTSQVPIIMLTARDGEEDKLLGFELGADEYVTKPFSPKVLVARAKTLLKRIDSLLGQKEDVLTVGDITIQKPARNVKIDGQSIELTHKEFELLLYLAENKGIVLSRESILDSIWGYDYYGDYRTVDTHIKKLRSKLGDQSKYICTVIRSGYKFEVPK
jgi:two-component system OmpR family response regulator